MRALMIRLGTYRRELAGAAVVVVLAATGAALWASGLLSSSQDRQRDGRELVELQRDDGTPAACRRAIEDLWSTAGSRIPAGFTPVTSAAPGQRAATTTVTAPDEATRAAAAQATARARQRVEEACP